MPAGQKYPATEEDFRKSALPGNFDATLAGKRMATHAPETWETQVSAKGNNAAVWESLIDHNKLPFMAGLRNLRNLVKVGISEQHHRRIIGRLERARSLPAASSVPLPRGVRCPGRPLPQRRYTTAGHARGRGCLRDS